MYRCNNKKIIITTCLLILIFVLAGCSYQLSDDDALEIVNEKLGLSISSDSFNVVETNYTTNIREYGFLIVADIECSDINEITHSLQLNPTSLSELEKEGGMPRELTSILNKYLGDNAVLFCRYEYGRLLNGKEHTASVYLICLSSEGRLILFEDI